jgi:branched-chain amino acid transport system ATP-binding protein
VSEILRLQSVSRHFSGLKALSDVSLSINKGEVLGLIGPNGAGKTTLVNVVTGVTPASSGTVTFAGQDITRVKTYQSARLGLSRTFRSCSRSLSFRRSTMLLLRLCFAA